MKITEQEKRTILELLTKIVNEDKKFSETEKSDAQYLRGRLKGLIE